MFDIKSVRRAFDILNLYTLGSAELGVSEVAQRLDMSKSTVARLMSTLKSMDILKKSTSSRKYCLDGKIMELAKVFLLNVDLRTIALTYLKELQEKTRETVFIHTIEEDKRVCIAVIESPQDLRRICAVGDYTPLHAGSPGKLLLAYLSDEQINELIARTGQPRITDITITSRKKLQKEIENIRKTGLAISHGEYTKFCYSISAPIRNYTGEVIAALTIAGIIMRTTPKMEDEFSTLVKEAATKISRELGYYYEVISRSSDSWTGKQLDAGAIPGVIGQVASRR